MPIQNKKPLSDRDICTKFIAPALTRGGKGGIVDQVREEVSLTKDRVIARGQLSARGEGKRADYVLYYKPGIPLANIEAKDNNHSVAAGMQQAPRLCRHPRGAFCVRLKRRRLCFS